MKTIKSFLSGTGLALVSLLVVKGTAMAQAIRTDDFEVEESIGSGITGIDNLVVFLINLLGYLGWVGVIVGVGLAIFGLIYKLFSADNEEAMATVQGYVTKAILIIMAGILLIGSRFIIRTVVSFIPGIGDDIQRLTPEGADELDPTTTN